MTPMTNEKIAMVLSRMSPGASTKVMQLRRAHACLMKLRQERVFALQRKAILLNYIEGEGRMLDAYPRYYSRPDRHGGSTTVETYFTYINRVH